MNNSDDKKLIYQDELVKAWVDFAQNPYFVAPIPSEADITLATVSTYRATLFDTLEKMVGSKGMSEIPKVVRVSLKGIGTTPFLFLDIALSYEEEGILKATITAILSNGVSISLAALFVYLLGKEITLTAVIIAAICFIITCMINAVSSKLIDGAYDYLKDWHTKIKYDIREKTLEIEADSNNIDEIKEFIRGIKGIKSVETVYVTSVTEDRTYKYKVVYGDTIWQMCKDNDITYEQLLEVNPWLKDRFSNDFSFALIKPDEEIIIPKKVKWEIDENIREEWEKRQNKISDTKLPREEIEMIVEALMYEILVAAKERYGGDGYFKGGSGKAFT